MPTAVRLKRTVMKTNVNAGRGKTGGNKNEQNGGASRNAKREVSKEGRSFGRKSLKEKSNVSEMPKRKLLGERGKHVVKEEAKNMRNRSKLPKKSGAWNGSKNAIGDSDSEETELPAKRPSFVKGRGTLNPERIVSKEGRYSGPKSLKDKSNILEVPKRKLLEKRGKSAVKDKAKNTRNGIKLPRKSGAWDSSKNVTDDSESEETELPAKRPASIRGRVTRKDDMSKHADSKRRFNDTRVKEKTGSSEVCNGRKKSSTRTIGKDLSVDGLSKDADSKRKTNARRVREKTGSLEVRDGRKKLSTRMIGKDLSAERGTRIGRVGLEEKSTIRKRKGNEIETLDRFSKRRATSKGTVDAKTVVVDEMPRKKKRTIRIDPYDISNKRLDDSVALKEKVVEEKPETSRNAQFRAIEPSPSIVSFVEDNLLGRRRLIDLRRAGYNIKLSAPLDNIPFSTNAERERIEENVFRNKLTFFAAAKVSSSFPPPEIPEIAFAGRSNVGKSSLLNALTRQWGVVRISDKPGLTQTINFFHLASKLCLVDLPGYGFAYAKEEVKDAWEELVKEYVSTRIGLKRVCVLIDTQWGMKPRDHELIDLMERSQTKYQIVLTKTDMVFPINVARRAMQIEENLKTSKSMVKPVMMVSSKSGAGIRSLRTVLANVVRFAK